MPGPPEQHDVRERYDVRGRMVRGAATLLARDGLAGTSFGTVLALTGAPRGSIYHHFPGGKQELVAEATRLTGRTLLDLLPTLPHGDAGEVAAGWCRVWRGVLERSDAGSGCAVAAVLTSAAATTVEAEVAAAVFAGWTEALAELLVRAGVRAAAAPGLASTLIAGVEGALVLGRAEHGLTAYDEVTASLVLLARTVAAA